MSGLIINGAVVSVPFPCTNYRDRPDVRLLVGRGLDGIDLGNDRGAGADVRMVIVHTTKGKLGVLRPGKGPPGDDGLKVARFWSTQDNRGGDKNHQSGAHIVIDRDGDVHCLADLGRVCAHHASNSLVNRSSIGIEIYQAGAIDGFATYEIQYERLIELLDVLTREFFIQRMCQAGYKGPVPRLVAGGADCSGIFGHRDVTSKRGAGDPGLHVEPFLVKAGYEGFDLWVDEDKQVWKWRQKDLGVAADGVPYKKTAAALEKAGRKRGQWVPRPGD